MSKLDGVRIVVTRAAHQAEELAHPLRELGAEVILLPVIGIGPPNDAGPLRRAAAHADDFDWIIFTSANAVRAFVAELPDRTRRARVRIATVGEATRRAAAERGFTVSLTPAEYVAESLVDEFRDEDLKGSRILIPSAAVTRDLVATELRKRGAHVDVVEAYRNVLPVEAAEQAAAVFQDRYPDWVLFASPSAVENLVSLVRAEALRRVKIASIGPITSEAVRKSGLEVAAEARPHSVQGLVKLLSS